MDKIIDYYQLIRLNYWLTIKELKKWKKFISFITLKSNQRRFLNILKIFGISIPFESYWYKIETRDTLGAYLWSRCGVPLVWKYIK